MKTIPPYFALLTILFFSAAIAYAEDSAALQAIFDHADEHSSVTIPPGDYFLDGEKPIKLRSNLMVSAYGARFHLPETLNEGARIVLFSGENISNFRWHGGHFVGRVFDPSHARNTWPPNANTRGIMITTTKDGATNNLTFQDISSNGLAGAAVTVLVPTKREAIAKSHSMHTMLRFRIAPLNAVASLCGITATCGRSPFGPKSLVKRNARWRPSIFAMILSAPI